MRSLALLAALGLLAACEPFPSTDDDDFAGAPEPEDCPEEQLFEATECDEIHCGDPVVRLGTGGSDFEAIATGDPVDIWYGSQGWYHIFISAEMEQLCPIVYLRTKMEIPWGPGGEPREIFSQQRHLQAVRPEPDLSTRQQYWGIQGFVPCGLFPDDPDESHANCGTFQSRSGFLEDSPLTISIEAEDHNGRIARASATVEPECCGE